MAQKVQVTRVSDVSGEEAQETVAFSLDGRDYEIDLSSGEAAELRDGLVRFTSRARRTGSRKRPGKRRASRDDLPEIRDYARSRGYDINDRGRVPQQIIAEYDALSGLRPEG